MDISLCFIVCESKIIIGTKNMSLKTETFIFCSDNWNEIRKSNVYNTYFSF